MDKTNPTPKETVAPIAAAYIGVSGETYRVRVPVLKIEMTRAEGPIELTGKTLTFDTWHGADWQLAMNQKTAPKRGADKHDFTITWADGEVYNGRYDLRADGSIPSLSRDVHSYLTFLATDERARNLPWISDALRARAAKVLVSHDLQQIRPSLAPAGWPVVRDYCDTPHQEGEPDLARKVYGLA